MTREIPGHMSEGAFARLMGLSVWAIRDWRRRGYGPSAVKFGRGVFYREGDVAAFIHSPAPDAAKA